jgi:hypothetical protein
LSRENFGGVDAAVERLPIRSAPVSFPELHVRYLPHQRIASAAGMPLRQHQQDSGSHHCHRAA